MYVMLRSYLHRFSCFVFTKTQVFFLVYYVFKPRDNCL